MPKPLASICIATHNKFPILDRVLQSIYAQPIARTDAVEVIVVDDGSADDTSSMIYGKMYAGIPIIYRRLDRTPGYRNPGPARNVAMRLARGDVLICQSDDVTHNDPRTIEKLLELKEGTYNIATVYNQYPDGRLGEPYTGVECRRPFFFLGSVLRKHVYAIGGNDEYFNEPGYDDNWFACCLHRGQGLEVVYRKDIECYHQDHPRPHNIQDSHDRMASLFWDRWDKAEHGRILWQALDGPWEWDEKDG